jgi:hypothetical protein
MQLKLKTKHEMFEMFVGASYRARGRLKIYLSISLRGELRPECRLLSPCRVLIALQFEIARVKIF